jgi:serralysin
MAKFELRGTLGRNRHGAGLDGSETEAEATGRAVLDGALNEALEAIGNWLRLPESSGDLVTAFGEQADIVGLRGVFGRLADGRNVPRIVVVDDEVLGGAAAAFDSVSRSIFVSERLLAIGASNTQLLTAVLLEELGHYADARVNSTDAPGDEGAIYAALVTGQELSAESLASMRVENDQRSLVIDGVSASLEFGGTYGAITVDGNLADWTAANRLDSAVNGVAGWEVYGRLDGGAYVFALRSTGSTAIGAETTFWLNTDQNAATGYQIWGFAGGAEYNVNFDALGQPALFTGASGQTAVGTGPLDFAYGAGNLTVEFAVPVASLAGNPQAINVQTDVNNSVFLPNDYSLYSYIVASPSTGGNPTVGNFTLDGSLADWSSAYRLDSGAMSVAGYELYGTVANNTFVFAIHAPVAIGATTTAWLNTDQNAATGYQIWGFAGGAEFNINFDAAGIPRLYTGDAGQTLVPLATPIPYGFSGDRTVVEFAVSRSDLGNPTNINTLYDVNNSAFLPASFSTGQYTIVDPAALPPRTDLSKKVAIVYSETTAQRFFGLPSVEVNKTGYSQFFMAAQAQAQAAGLPFDIITESDLSNLATLVNYDAIIFPSFEFVPSASVAAITNTLTLLTQNYSTSLITAGNFMTSDENGVALAGDPYARMRQFFDLAPDGGGFPAAVSIAAAGSGFAGSGGYTTGEVIDTYAAAGWLRFADATPGVSALTTIANQTVSGQPAPFAAVVTSELNGDRNVHFATNAFLGDNNLLADAIQWAALGAGQPSVALHMSRNSSIFASRNDMDQSQVIDSVSPSGAPGIYAQLVPILQQWKQAYNFVGSYYINVGDNPAEGLTTNWPVSLPYYQAILALGNEIGTHSLTHLEAANLANNTNNLVAGTGPGTFDYEFNQSRLIIQQAIAAAVPGFTVRGAAVPGAPETISTSQQIMQYFNYISGGYSGTGAGYPNAFGYLTPSNQNAVYLAPNVTFDFTRIEFQGMTPEQAEAAWAQEWADLTAHADLPVILWPWHDYGPTNWVDPGSTDPAPGYNLAMFTNFIANAFNAGAEFVTLDDLAQRIAAHERARVTFDVVGDTITATVTPDATAANVGDFALDIENSGLVIQNAGSWYAYDADSIFLPRTGGTFTINLGTSQDDVTHISALPMRSELVSVTGNGTNISFTAFGEGTVTVDLRVPGNNFISVTGVANGSLTGDILSLDMGAIGDHIINVTQAATANGTTVADLIFANGSDNSISGGGGNDTLHGLGGADTLNGGSGNDRLFGGDGGDRLLGSSGIDALYGGAGVDVIIGGSSRDSLFGGTEGDIFILQTPSESGASVSARDVIGDYEAGLDRIDVSLVDADSLLIGNQAFSFLSTAGAAFTAAGQLRYRYETIGGVEHTIIEGNQNTNFATAEFSIDLVGRYTTLTASDFVL